MGHKMTHHRGDGAPADPVSALRGEISLTGRGRADAAVGPDCGEPGGRGVGSDELEGAAVPGDPHRGHLDRVLSPGVEAVHAPLKVASGVRLEIEIFNQND